MNANTTRTYTESKAVSQRFLKRNTADVWEQYKYNEGYKVAITLECGLKVYRRESLNGVPFKG